MGPHIILRPSLCSLLALILIISLPFPIKALCEQEDYSMVRVTIVYDPEKEEIKEVSIEGTIYVFERNTLEVKIVSPVGTPLEGISVEVKPYPGYTGGGVSFSPTDVLKGITRSDGTTSLVLTPDKGGVIELYIDGIRVKPELWIRYKYLPPETLAFVVIVGVALFSLTGYLVYKVIKGARRT